MSHFSLDEIFEFVHIGNVRLTQPNTALPQRRHCSNRNSKKVPKGRSKELPKFLFSKLTEGLFEFKNKFSSVE